VTAYQCVVLLLFSHGNAPITTSFILAETELEEAECIRTLRSLSASKYKLIVKHPKSKDILPTDTFTFNSEFESPLMRLKISFIQVKERQVVESTAVTEQVFEDRQASVDAAIVRIMKGRKEMKHSGLVGELLTVLMVPVKIVDVKKRIESLINRGYVERDAKDPLVCVCCLNNHRTYMI
jgi:cullin-4